MSDIATLTSIQYSIEATANDSFRISALSFLDKLKSLILSHGPLLDISSKLEGSYSKSPTGGPLNDQLIEYNQQLKIALEREVFNSEHFHVLYDNMKKDRDDWKKAYLELKAAQARQG